MKAEVLPVHLAGGNAFVGDAEFLEDSAGPFMRGVARMPIACTGRIHTDLIRQTGLLHLVPEHSLSHGGTADVAQTNKQNLYHALILPQLWKRIFIFNPIALRSGPCAPPATGGRQ
ncbi:hypothetical protein D3C75_1102240 [compost metagenome]